MSATPYREPERQAPAVEIFTGFLASAAIFVGLFALAYRPVRMAVPAMVLALIATGIGGRFHKLSAAALAVAFVGFVGGLVIQVLVDHPIF